MMRSAMIVAGGISMQEPRGSADYARLQRRANESLVG